MDDINLGTINGKPIDKELLDALSKRCERDFEDREVIVVPTSHGQALAALRALDIPVEEIEALERRAQHENRPLSVYLRGIIRSELAS
jgi:rhodanese-related sulfurtransferase